jgi:RNA polymerase sigma-70 factor (ECF subfamily)
MWQAGRAAWPGLRLGDAEFRDYLAARNLPAGGTDATPESAADLYLACACTNRTPGAVEAFLARFEREVRVAAARVDGSAAFHDEVRQTLAETLFVPTDRPRIAQYAGRGPLAAWVAIAARRIAGRLRGNVRNAGPLDEEAIALEAMGIEADPAMLYLKQRYGDEVRAALVEAFGALAPEDRTLMRLSLVDRLSLEEVGRAFGVSQSTISRKAERIRQDVLAATRRRLREKLGASADEIESLIKMVQSQVEVSFSRILA